MASDSWTDKLDAYVDGELAPDLSRSIEEHLRGCAACAAAALAKVQQAQTAFTDWKSIRNEYLAQRYLVSLLSQYREG